MSKKPLRAACNIAIEFISECKEAKLSNSKQAKAQVSTLETRIITANSKRDLQVFLALNKPPLFLRRTADGYALQSLSNLAYLSIFVYMYKCL